MRDAVKFTSLFLLIPVFLMTGCVTVGHPEQSMRDKSSCHIIYDAGSSGTRLYVYEWTADGWLKHGGATSPALADPVRSIYGNTPEDIPAVVDQVVASLVAIQQAGPADRYGKQAWAAFDWRVQCEVETVSVLATAGMRMAEAQNPAASELLWNLLNQEIRKKVGMPVISRSIPGFEEGLYAWIAEHELQGDTDFGIVEMGGGSLQVSFPCQPCKTSRQVLIEDQMVPMYSYAFSGWGQDELLDRLGSLPACEKGAGKKDPDWQETDCSVGFSSFRQFASEPRSNMEIADIAQWYVGGAFQYMKDDDIERYCQEDYDSDYQPESACFRAVYQRNVLDSLGLEMRTAIADFEWTLGAVICTATRCLER